MLVLQQKLVAAWNNKHNDVMTVTHSATHTNNVNNVDWTVTSCGTITEMIAAHKQNDTMSVSLVEELQKSSKPL